MENKRIDEATGTETVGHEWDGIEELNTPLPRWWLWTFYLTIIFAIGYVIAYPAIPMVSKATEGMLGWSSRGQLADEMTAADLARQDFREQLAVTDLNKMTADPQLLQQAVAGGAAAFKVNCVQCHGSGAAGVQDLGYPNLNDDDWLWGGDIESIHYSITYGIRQPEDNDMRQSIMPTFDGALDSEQINAVVDHVLSLSGKAEINPQGEQLFADNCAACHGPDGTGMRIFGAPNLADAIWLRGDRREAISSQILHPKMGAMPAWKDRLDPVTIKMLAAYVHSLGGGEETVVPVEEPAADAQGAAEGGADSDGPA